MSRKNKPLPKPPSTPFGRKRHFEDEESKPSLMADRMAMAMAEGRLDDFLREELPDSEHARKLAEMMAGMTGMTPMPLSGNSPHKNKKSAKNRKKTQGRTSLSDQPPEDVVSAVKSGDVQALKELLQREHKKRSPCRTTDNVHEEGVSPSSPQASIEKAIIEQLIKIAADNDLSLDWIFFRALKKYVEDYKKTGNL